MSASSLPPPHIRLAQIDDLTAINDIYSYSVLYSTATYQTEPSTIEERAAWFAAQDAKHPVIVAEADGKVVGWGSLAQFRQRAAYRHSVEESVYIHHDYHRRGIGRAILNDLLARAQILGHHRVIATISGDQEPSLALHRAMGFLEVGRLTEIGFKFGRWLDVVYLEYHL
jgi:phosphinothricin acetyltransferase